MATPSRACCSIPPIVSEGYKYKGGFETIDGLKTYVTGPKDSKHAILIIYDVFGFFDQTIQGADILANSDSKRKYRVFMPDFFDGNPADISWYPPQTEDHQKKLGNFFQTQAVPQKSLQRIPGIVAAANETATAGKFESWAILGHCWGGKIATLVVSGDGGLFKAAVQCHPAMLDPNDAKSVAVPMALLASKDEPAEDVEAFEANLTVPHHVTTFPTQIHGFMAARSDLKDAAVRKEYERGYQVVLEFLSRYT
ncbi:carboxymethylenebutenolidase [Cladophialophora yegresii CBS 114405]|uniref:Carboxymethylenebutenolidase n=1 Tax=Cladophialophora yegresii CBS 114405 TaxID=1182544 RepID=W9VU88_9EURO|nr:carboxymethylenebutenolidase [Cladophialophora yegresii CBS 114405]EXJ59133.1 carboxymethylenebutenolidase [Cladophialophora yegresii CBS 114405]